MSAQDFEVISPDANHENESHQSLPPNHSQPLNKMSNENQEEEEDANLITSDVEYTNSQSVSLHKPSRSVSHLDSPHPHCTDSDKENNGIQNAIESSLVSPSNSPPPLPPGSPLCSFTSPILQRKRSAGSAAKYRDIHDLDANLNRLDLNASNAPNVSSPNSPLSASYTEVVMEQSPEQSPDQTTVPFPPSRISRVSRPRQLQHSEHKDLENEDDRDISEHPSQPGSTCGVEGDEGDDSPNDSDNPEKQQNPPNPSNPPAISSNICTPQKKSKSKIYDNPYLNGSHSTPGMELSSSDGDDYEIEDEYGEESDHIDSQHDEESEVGDGLQPANLTFGDEDDYSDDEDEPYQQQQINGQQRDIRVAPNGPDADRRGREGSSSWCNPITILSVIAALVAVAYCFVVRPRVPLITGKPEAPKFHCPDPVMYVPMDGNPFYVDASHPDHPATTKYEWDVVNMMEFDDLLVDGEDTAALLLMKGATSGQIDIDLSISTTAGKDNIYVFNKQCSLQILFHESPYFGIDLGTTYSCIAYQERQTKERATKIVVADKHRAEYCIPTAIYFPPPSALSQKVIIGEDALKKMATDPRNVIYDIKRIVGRSCDDPQIQIFRTKHGFQVDCDGVDDVPKILIPNLNDGNGEYIAPEQALAVILAHLVEIASQEFGVPYIRDVVVSIPALFHNGQRKAIRSSCTIAGLNVRQLVVEPTAAALAYSYYSSTPDDNFKLFLTFDMGGGTIDCSVLRCTGVDCQVLGVKGNSSLGGIDFDYIIRDIMVQKYEEQHGWDNVLTSPKLNAKFLKVAERVKKSLSVSSRHQVTMTNDELQRALERYTEKKQVIITRKEFEEHPRTKELIDSAIETAKEAINTERIKASNIRMILMIGGTTKIPIIQRRLKEEFGVGSVGRELKLVFPDDDPQLMVVKGSAIIGASLVGGIDGKNENALKQIVLEDVIPLSLGFGICVSKIKGGGHSVGGGPVSGPQCGVMDVIIEKNSHYPTRAQVTYCQKDPKSSVAKLDLYEGENEMVKDNYLLSHLSISGIPPRDPSICDSIIVEFIIDKNGIAMIEAVVNDRNSPKEEKQKFRNTLSVVSDDGNLSKGDIQSLRNGMISWFDGHESIQEALQKQ